MNTAFGDREPCPQDARGLHCWFAREAVEGLDGFEDHPQSNLPRAIIDLMPADWTVDRGGGVRSSCGSYMTYPSRDDAFAALEVAVAAYLAGRSAS